MQIFLPLRLRQYFEDIDGVKITNHGDHIQLDIDESPQVLIDIFYRGAEYGVDSFHHLAKENLQKSAILNNFRLN